MASRSRAALLGGHGERESDHRAIVRRGDTEIGALDGLLDGRQGALVVGGDHEEAGLWDAEAGHLAQLGLSPVVVHFQVFDESRGRPSGADGAELGLGVIHGLSHVLPGVGDHQRCQVIVH
jgi:hypothetical protein